MSFPRGSDGKVSACNVGDLDLIPGLGRSFGEGHDNPLQYSCLENPMDRRAWWATVMGSQWVRHDWATNTLLYFTLHPSLAHEAPLSIEFSRQEYWNGLSCPSPRDLPDTRIEPGSATSQADSLPSEPPGKPPPPKMRKYMKHLKCLAWWREDMI